MLKIYRRTNVTKGILLKYRSFLTFWSEIIYKAKYNDVQLSNNQLEAVTFAWSVLQTQNQISIFFNSFVRRRLHFVTKLIGFL